MITFLYETWMVAMSFFFFLQEISYEIWIPTVTNKNSLLRDFYQQQVYNKIQKYNFKKRRLVYNSLGIVFIYILLVILVAFFGLDNLYSYYLNFSKFHFNFFLLCFESLSWITNTLWRGGLNFKIKENSITSWWRLPWIHLYKL